MYEYSYPMAALAADVVLTRGTPAGAAEVLLIQRLDTSWALPGGFVDISNAETFIDCAARELAEETGILLPSRNLRFVTMQDAPDRDPRGRVISCSFEYHMQEGKHDARLTTQKAGDDAVALCWVSLSNLDIFPLAFDHLDILQSCTKYSDYHISKWQNTAPLKQR
jgi:8-oxo-dGTP diphosphatase